MIRCRRTHRGFTLIEVMLAVMILAFVATAAIKLVIYAQNGLSLVKQKRALIDQAIRIQTEMRTDGDISPNDKSGDITWTTENMDGNYFGSDFGLLNFKGGASDDIKEESLSWRKLSVKNQNDEIVLCLPAQSAAGGKADNAAISPDAATSSDKKK